MGAQMNLEPAINVSPSAILSWSNISKKALRVWLEAASSLKPSPALTVVRIESRSIADELLAAGLITQATYRNKNLASEYRIPKAVAFVTLEPTIS